MLNNLLRCFQLDQVSLFSSLFPQTAVFLLSFYYRTEQSVLCGGWGKKQPKLSDLIFIPMLTPLSEFLFI